MTGVSRWTSLEGRTSRPSQGTPCSSDAGRGPGTPAVRGWRPQTHRSKCDGQRQDELTLAAREPSRMQPFWKLLPGVERSVPGGLEEAQ